MIICVCVVCYVNLSYYHDDKFNSIVNLQCNSNAAHLQVFSSSFQGGSFLFQLFEREMRDNRMWWRDQVGSRIGVRFNWILAMLYTTRIAKFMSIKLLRASEK